MLFLVLLVVWIASAFFCASVADSKGYSYAGWFIGGFLFGFIALIAAAGLPDKKLRKYILQIGLKQDAIKEETLVQDVYEERKFRFTTKLNASNDEVYKELLSTIKRCGYQNNLMNLELSILKYKKDFLGSMELNCRNEDDIFVLTVKGKEIYNEEIEWSGTL
tara:strand:+ start:123 stop:611 length:489 start_codon:yes stop_codon:yes gene_type:complete